MSARVLEVLGYAGRGGAARSVLELAQFLPRDGFEVTIAAPSEPGFAEAAAATGARFVAVPMAGRGDWRSFSKLVQVLRRERFDVVHTHCRNADLHGGLAAAVLRATTSFARTRPPALVAHLRGLLVDGDGRVSSGVIDRAHREFLRRGPDRIVAISEAVRSSALAQLGLPAERIVTVRNGIDCDRYGRVDPQARRQLRREFAIPRDAPLLLAMGTLGRCKGQDVLLRALPQLPSDVHVLCVGEGDARTELAPLAESLGVTERVRFAGPRDDVPELLATCDLLVHPARWEGFGRAVAEAMAAARPLVASAVGGIPEFVDDGRTGLLVVPDRPELLAAAVRRLLGDAAFARQLATAAQASARESLDVRRTARAVAELLRRAAGLPASGRPEQLAGALP